MWDGPDGMGIGRVGDAMRSVAMQMGLDLMLCVAMPWDWIYSTMGGSVVAGCSSAFDDGAVFCCSLVGLRRWRGDPLFARRLPSVVIIILSSFIIHNCSSFINIYHSL